MTRSAQDDLDAYRVLDEWLKQRPDAAIVIAMVDENTNGEIEVMLRHSTLAGHHLIALIQALVERTAALAEQTPPAVAKRLHRVRAFLDEAASD